MSTSGCCGCDTHMNILPPRLHSHIIKNKVLEKNVMKGDLCGRLRYALLQVWVLALVYLH